MIDTDNWGCETKLDSIYKSRYREGFARGAVCGGKWNRAKEIS